MRLDHLLSRERIEEETRRFIPGRYTGNCVGSAQADKEKRNPSQDGRVTVLLLEPVSFSGIAEKRNLMYFENCTARWKTSCKETSCECVRRHAQKCDNFAVGLRRKANQRKIFNSYSDSDDQVTKGAGWMPWHWTPKKDVVSCEKPRGAASRL